MRALRHPFNLTPAGRMSEARSYEDIVRGQVIDALMTNQGERVMRPRYGCDIQSALFDPTDELILKDAASQIKNKLSMFVGRALINSVTIQDGGNGSVFINVSYRSSLYGVDTTMTVPVSSEFLRRQLERGES